MPIEPLSHARQAAMVTEFRRAFRHPTPELVPVEGPRLIGEAIRSGLRLEKVLFSRTGLEQHGNKLSPQLSKHTEAGVAEDKAFATAMDVEQPQGVAALVRLTPATLPDVFGDGSTPPLVVVAAEMQDPGNLGTLIRAADAFGATGVVVLADTVSPFNPKAVRASAGSLFHLPVVAKVAAPDLIAACEKRSVKMWATATRSDMSPVAAGLHQPVALVIGQEASGVPRALVRAAAGAIAIPMVRPVESLNAGIAAAIVLYEAARQRHA